MKEVHLFYAPDVTTTHALGEEEATHAVRVLRIKEGDALWVTDGAGHFYDATATPAGSSKHPECFVSITAEHSWQKPWRSNIHIGVAPTKNMDRIEWFAEKATEIGLDGIHFLDCANSERRVVKTDRIERIVVSAMKQSHKAVKPVVSEMTRFKDFVSQPFEGDKFIAHCYEQADVVGNDDDALRYNNDDDALRHDDEAKTKYFLFDVVRPDVPTLVLIGPEGDFSIDEVRAAHAAGFRSITLGESRLRTETAALIAVAHMNLKKTTLCKN